MKLNKSAHVQIITEIAKGLHNSGMLLNYLELGVQHGSCFNNVAPLAKNAFAVDINKDSFNFIKNNRNLHWFHGSTAEFLNKFKGDMESKNSNICFDLVFIDADHRYESSLADFHNVFPLVNKNGLILLHDTYPPNEDFISKSYCGDTYKTAWYIKNNYMNKCEIVTLPFYMGISIVRKSTCQLAWDDKR